MKLKEIPPYLYHSIKLKLKPARYLNNSSKKNSVPVIVSLTTIPSRLHGVHLTIRSILHQESKPEKVILWLHEDLKSIIPNSLRKLQGNIFEFRYSKNDFPHLKLLHSLEEFSETNIVTIDDDMMYPYNFIKLLHDTHQNFPKDIITNRGRNIDVNSKGNFKEYNKWLHLDSQPLDNRFVLQLGVYGVLYPPNSLHHEATNVPLLLRLSPKADDLWYKAMAMLKGTTVRIVEEYSGPPVLIIGSQKVTLKHQNTRKDYNRVQWKQLTEYFNLDIPKKL